jgi:large subunit ribosomal protein L4
VATADVRDQAGVKSGSRELPSELFEAAVNVPLMHQVVVAGLAAIRRGTHSTKTRAEVRGGGKKPWRQKGTGRARHGSIRSPIWSGGGVAHGPKPRDYTMRVNKKMKRSALRGALTDAAQSNKLAIVNDLSFEEPSTKDALATLAALGLAGRTLVVLQEPQRETELSFRNLPHVKVTYSKSLSVYDLVAADHVLFTEAALDVLEGKEPAPDSAVAKATEPAGERSGGSEHQKRVAPAKERSEAERPPRSAPAGDEGATHEEEQEAGASPAPQDGDDE